METEELKQTYPPYIGKVDKRTVDITGQRFGRLTVLYRTENRISPKGSSYRMWVCRCDCGTVKTVMGGHLTSGHSTSCGCYNIDKTILANKTHGLTNTRLYRVWTGIKRRCNNPNELVYSYYGGRGIKVCDEWGEFEPFMEWSLAHGYSDDLTIERINVDGNYEPSNCKWIPFVEQSRNRRSNHFIEYDGEVHCLVEWAEIKNIPRKTLNARINRGWPIERALNEPYHSEKTKRNN